jgi:amino acid adenylation domain-containing protein
MMFFFESSDSPAVSDGHSSLTYRELNRRADSLADKLRKLGVSADVVVGICMPRNVNTVAAILGILRAGGAYLPIEIDQPVRRLEHIIKEVRPSLILVQDKGYASQVADLAPIVTCEEVLSTTPSSAASGAAQRVVDPPEGLAYVLYTSGSTGRPKGLGMTRAGAMNVMLWEAVERRRSDRGAQLARLSFDISFQEIMATLLGRGHIVMLPDQCRADHRELLNVLAERQIERLHLTPTALAELAREFSRRPVSLSLRSVVVSGEKLRLTEQIRQFMGALPAATLENVYGMTELHNVCSMLLSGDPKTWPAEPSVGKPIWNTEVLVLDDDDEIRPPGEIGHICVSGLCVSRGYYRSPRTTAGRYLPSSHAQAPGGRMYYTGDLGRRLEDGSIQITGRADRQIKHHGYRMDPAEIEAALLLNDEITAAIVCSMNHSDDSAGELMAYYVTRDGRSLDGGSLRASLRLVLPDYMVPNRFIGLAALPVTSTGKVDQSALPGPPNQRPAGVGSFVAPRDHAEARLADIWAEVLGLDKVGIQDDFFALGGDSLRASRIASEFNAIFEPGVPVRRFFDERTIERMLGSTSAVRRVRAPSVPAHRVPSGEEVVSAARRRFWYQHQQFDNTTWINNVVAYRVEGGIDVSAVESGLTEIARRHSALRETVFEVDGEASVTRAGDARIGVLRVNLQGVLAGRSQESAVRLIRDRIQRWADQDTVSPLRCVLLTLDPRRHVLALALNHMSSDARSEHILSAELSELYSAFVCGRRAVLPEVGVGYGDYAVWERDWLNGSEAGRQLDYWRSALAGLSELELPVDRVRSVQRRADGRSVPFVFDAGLSAEVERLCRENRVSVFMFLVAVFGVVLSRYAGQEDIAVGTPVAGRSRHEFENVIGLFVNTVVLRSRARGDAVFTDYLGDVREAALGAFENQDLPFDRVVEELRPHRDLSRNPLFQVMFAFDSLGPPRLRLEGLEVEEFVVPPRTTQFDLALEMGVTGAGVIGGQAVFATDLFEPATVQRLVHHYERVVRTVVDQPSVRLADIELMTPAERAATIHHATGPALPPSTRLIHESFADHAASAPTHTAVVEGRHRRSYQQLDEAANQLAHQLQALGVRLEKPVGVFLPRGERLLTALLAVLKAGGVYLPLDPALPDERINHMVTDATAEVIITTSTFAPRVARAHAETLCLDSTESSLRRYPTTAPPSSTHPENLAYIIYTSGSSGRPKGTAVPHRAILNTLEWSLSRHRIRRDDRIVSHSPISFDASIWELFAPLYGGATLLIAPDGPSSREQLTDYCAANGATVLQVVPSLLTLMLSQPVPAQPHSLRLILSGGEALSNEVCRKMQDKYQIAIDNVYGPTECAVDATAWSWDGSDTGSSPIGTAINNVRAMVLDSKMNIVPPGLRGVLHLGGECLARGYLANPRLTAECFVPDPFGAPGTRMYVTGDVVVSDSTGRLDFLGRSDRQVKLLGRRVELGEVESAAMSLPAVSRAAVLLDGPETARRLVCFVTPERGETLNPDRIRQALKKLLPSYMVPNLLVDIGEMPSTRSGKTDYVGLREMLDTLQTDPTEDEDLRTEWERRVADVLADVLGITEVKATHSFMALGGQSVNGIRFIRRMNADFATNLSLRNLFDDLTVRELALVAEKSAQNDDR